MLKRKSKSALAVVGMLVLLSGILGVHGQAKAAVASWQKGVNMFPNYNTDFSSSNFQQSVRNAAGVGVNYIFLDVPLYQSNVNSTDLQTGGTTPTDQSLADGINFIHSLGLHVALKFEVFPYDGQWSAYINPSDRTTWFKNYASFIDHYATIAKTSGAEELVLGTELISMSSANVNGSNTANWQSLIGGVRSIYPGKLTYSANWGGDSFSNEKDAIQFWSSLDYIGLSAYFNLSGDGSVSSLMQSWSNWNNSDVAPLANKWGKPVIFTELGYKSIFDSYQHPWMWWEGGGAAPNQQANDYQALFQYWDQQPFMQGVALWYWSTDPNAGGSGNTDYTPQNKAAQATMQTWFTAAGGGGGGGGGGGVTGTPAFTTSASANPTSPTPGQSTSFALAVTDTASSTSGANVDAEIYNSGGSQVFQQIFQNQNFTSGGTQNYTLSWTAGSADSYALKVGVFNGNWQQLYYWTNSALAFSVGSGGGSGGGGGGGGGSTSTTGGAINIWWPTNGATISGVQPFKAMLTNNSADSYNMFWQVDGGQQNPMATNNTDYPHKESLVDVGPWTWNSGGTYGLTFTAQNLSGQTVAQSAITVQVTH